MESEAERKSMTGIDCKNIEGLFFEVSVELNQLLPCTENKYPFLV